MNKEQMNEERKKMFNIQRSMFNEEKKSIPANTTHPKIEN